MKNNSTFLSLRITHYSLLLMSFISLLFITSYLFAFSYLKISLGAKPASLGDSYTAQADDLNTIEFNPAGIARIYRLQALSTHINWYEDTSIYSIAFGAPLVKGKSAIAIGFNMISVEDVVRSSYSIISAGDIKFENLSGYFGYGIKVYRDVFLGTAVKILYERLSVTNLPRQTSIPTLIDFGLLYLRPLRGDAFGISIQNIELINREKDFIPTVLRLGNSTKIAAVNFLADLNLYRTYRKNEYLRYKIGLGLDYAITEFFNLRFGVKYQDYIDLTFGLGFRWREIYVDYAYSGHVDLGNNHRISLGMKF